MRVGPSRLALIDVGRQSGQEAVLPHRRMFPRRRALPHQSGSRCLTGPPAEPQLLFRFINQSSLMLALWSCGRRAASSKRSGKSTGFCWPVHLVRIRGSSPSIDCGFDAHRTSHPVAVLRAAGTTIPHSRGHRAREGGSTLYGGISQPLFATVRPPGSKGLIRPRGTRDNDPAFPGGSVWLHDSTRRDLAMVDISREDSRRWWADHAADRDAAHRRGTGVRGNDDIRETWSPYGTGDMLERATIIGWKADFRRDEQVGVVFDLVSTAGAQALGIGNYGITVGGAANLSTIAASCVAEAVAAHPPRRLLPASRLARQHLIWGSSHRWTLCIAPIADREQSNFLSIRSLVLRYQRCL